MKHTPGPWRVIENRRTSKPDRFGRTTTTTDTFINGANGAGSIAKCYVGHAADARLIAAAPELLWFAQYMSEYRDFFDTNMTPQDAARIRAAIAKATQE